MPITDRRVAEITSLAMIGAVLAPLAQNWRTPAKDSFPLSYYPMFTKKRRRTARENYLVGLDRCGHRQLLPYTCAGTGGLNQVRRQINRMVRSGQADVLCRSVAATVAGRSGSRYETIVTVQVVTGTYGFGEYFGGHRQPQRERVRAVRQIPR